MDINVHFVILSFSTKKDIKGTKRYPNDSKIGMSFRLTPLLIAVMLMNSELKKIV